MSSTGSNHYKGVIEKAKELPSEVDLDPRSPAEAKVLAWISACPIVNKYQPEVNAQFKLGEYLNLWTQTTHTPPTKLTSSCVSK